MRFLVSLAIALTLVSSAYSQIPTDVLEPYKAYKLALESGDQASALKAAERAYKAAEKSLNKHKTTGDLAQNYAESLAQSGGQEDLVVKTYVRSAELAQYYDEDAVSIEIDRYIKAAAAKPLYYRNSRGEKALKKARALIDDNSLQGTVYDGEIKTLESKLIIGSDQSDVEPALAKIDEAIAILEKPKDDLSTPYLHIARLQRAHLLKGYKDDIEVALAYQTVMQDVEGLLSEDHPYVRMAFGNWLGARYDLAQDDRVDEAAAAGVCDCWPYETRDPKLEPLIRFPPKMPKEFLNKSQYSGEVLVIFDVDDHGRTKSIRKVSATHEMLVEPSIEAVKEWKYTPASDGGAQGSRKGVVSKLRFMITNQSGRTLPMPEGY